MRTVSHAESAVDALESLYDASCKLAAECLATGAYERYRDVVYPRLEVEVTRWRPIDRTEPFGYVNEAGCYAAVLSRPRITRSYLLEQLNRLTSNYPCTIRVGPSTVRIPPEYIPGLGDVGEARRAGDLSEAVPRPTLDDVHDAIIDGEWEVFHGPTRPLFHFGPQRFDLACARIAHYTGMEVDTLQKFILFTNYPMHTTEFFRYAVAEVADPESRYDAVVLAGRRIDQREATRLAAKTEDERTPFSPNFQMPRLDLVTARGDGITMINIGVGPSNAKTITDSLAVLRPEAWIMIGHCAGLDGRMRIGDLILGNAYQREDHVLDNRIGTDLPIPAIPEVQRALEAAVKRVYGENQQLMRTGTVLSTDDRNWEWHTPRNLWEWLRGSTAVACDMESCTLAANGYRYRVPYGTLLSVSDLPLHAVPKLPAQAQAFYDNSKQAHVICAVRAMEYLAEAPQRLRTRKLRRTLAEVPFR